MRKELAPLLFFIALFIAIGCMGSGGPTNGTTAATNGGATGGTTVPVTMSGTMSFTPQIVNAHAGDTVQWTNNTGLTHTVTSDTGQPGPDSSTQSPGGIGPSGTFSWTVPANATVGTNYFYHCLFHGAAGTGTALGTGMTGEITVN